MFPPRAISYQKKKLFFKSFLFDSVEYKTILYKMPMYARRLVAVAYASLSKLSISRAVCENKFYVTENVACVRIVVCFMPLHMEIQNYAKLFEKITWKSFESNVISETFYGSCSLINVLGLFSSNNFMYGMYAKYVFY